jgi:hypothetical protein
MQAIAAWVGAVLGIINLTFAVSGRRPPMFIRHKDGDRTATAFSLEPWQDQRHGAWR